MLIIIYLIIFKTVFASDLLNGNQVIDFETYLSNNVTVEFPYLVGLISRDDPVVVCTGTLVTSLFVMSSAHCASRLKTKAMVSVNIRCYYAFKKYNYSKLNLSWNFENYFFAMTPRNLTYKHSCEQESIFLVENPSLCDVFLFLYCIYFTVNVFNYDLKLVTV